MAISNCLFLPTYGNPSGYSIQLVLVKLVAKARNKPYTTTFAII